MASTYGEFAVVGATVMRVSGCAKSLALEIAMSDRRFPTTEAEPGRLVSRFLVLLVLTFATFFASGQEATILALRGDGTATVVVDKAARKAWITDGGKSGANGVRDARVGQQDVLGYLIGLEIADLTITCSHPHSDHMGGLEDMIQDIRLLGFRAVRFVDAGLPKSQSLYAKFESKWAFLPTKNVVVSYQSAVRTNAFAGNTEAGQKIRVDNFVYDPDRVGKTDHDRSVIMQYTIAGPTKRSIVDFDDASPALIKHWVERKGARATVVIHPHHGSRNNSIEPLLRDRKKIGLVDVVITVNRNNRYLHPAPEVFLGLLKALGPEHVFVTDSDLGENVTVTGTETRDASNADGHIARLRAFAESQIERFEARLRHKYQTDRLLDPTAIEVSWNARNTKKATRSKDVAIPAAIRLLLDGALAYEQAIAILDNASGPKKSGRPPFGKDRRPAPEEGGGSSPDGPPDKPGSGTGEFFKLEEWAEEDLGSRGSRSIDTSERFKAEVSIARPRYGGIVLGNVAAGMQMSTKPGKPQMSPKSIHWVDVELATKDDDRQVAIRIETADATTVDYVNVTNAELWTAYNFVQPSKKLQTLYKRSALELTSPAVVGVSNSKTGQVISLSPAFAGTTAGWTAIYADHVVGEAHSAFRTGGTQAVPLVFREMDWPNFKWEMLQWFDAPASLVAAYTNLQVAPQSEPHSCLLRMRIAKREREVTASEFNAAAVQELSSQFSVDGKKALASASEMLAGQKLIMTKEERASYDREVAGYAFQMLARDVGGRYVDGFLYRVDRRASARVWASREWPATSLVRACADYPPLAEMDRIARVVAILNWYKRTMKGELPDLPSWVTPIWKSTKTDPAGVVDPYWPRMYR